MKSPFVELIFVILIAWILYKAAFLRSLFSGVFSVFGKITQFLMSGFNNDAHWMPWYKRICFLSRDHKGLTVNGTHRLSEKHSYQSMITVGLIGSSKTTTQIIPHALTVVETSIVMTDLSGELYTICAGELERKGYDIKVIDLMGGQGHGFNPLFGLQPNDYDRIAQVANVIATASGQKDSGDQFWANSAENLLKLIITCLVNLQEDQYLNLANVRTLLNKWGDPDFDQFVVRATLNDPETFDAYRGFLSGNSKTISSIQSSAYQTLARLNPYLSRMTARHDIDFLDLRRRPTALFIKVRPQDMGHYGFLLNLIFTQICDSLLSDLNLSQSGLPVHMLLDEAGSINISGCDTYIANARKFRVANILILQSLSQLETQYGRTKAQTIIDSCATEVYFPGMQIELAGQLARRVGKRSRSGRDGVIPLMREDQIQHMKENEALLLHGGKEPNLLKMTPYFKQRALKKRANRPVSPLSIQPFPAVSYVPLVAQNPPHTP